MSGSEFLYMSLSKHELTENAMDNFLFKNKTQLLSTSAGGKYDTNQKQKNEGPFWWKRLFSKTFHINRVLNREKPKKQREKSWQDVSVNLSENIPTITKTTTYKSSVFTGNVTPYWKLHNTHEWKS